MSDQFGGGPAGLSPEMAQRNSVEIFLNTIEGAIRASKTFAETSNNRSLENIFRNLSNALKKCFAEGEEKFDLEIRGAQIFFQKRKIYENKDKNKSLSLLFQESGIRVVRFKDDFTPEELSYFLKLLQTDFSSRAHVDEDLYCLFKEKEFQGFEVFAGDILKERLKTDPEFKESSKEFNSLVQKKTVEKKTPEPRRLRKDDLKIIEEFTLSPAQFARSDEEISKIVRSISRTESATGQEKAAIERLALMGFHFLLQEGENEQVQVGRDLLQQVCQLALDEREVGLFSALVRKVLQLHRDRESRRGEFQKILDFIFSTDHVEQFRELLNETESQKETVKLLLSAPPSAVRLVVLLMSDQPWMSKTFGDFVFDHISDHADWLDEQVQKNPDSPNWEKLINIMSGRPTPQLIRFVSRLFETCGDSMRAKVLKQCAEIGTTESLKVFQKQIRSEDPQDRELVYAYLPYSKSKPGASILRTFIESETFESVSRPEKEKAYAALFRIGGVDSWVKTEWMKEGSGFFKSKALNERRMAMLRAIVSTGSDLIEPLLELSPLDSLPAEHQSLAQKALERRKESKT